MNRIGIRTANSKVPVCQLVCIPSRFSQVLILPFSVAQEQDRKKRELGPARKISVCASPPWFHPPLHKVMDSGRPVYTMDTWMAVTLFHRFNIHSCWSFFSWYREIIFGYNQGFPDQYKIGFEISLFSLKKGIIMRSTHLVDCPSRWSLWYWYLYFCRSSIFRYPDDMRNIVQQCASKFKLCTLM